MREFLVTGVCALLVLFAPVASSQADYPSKPVRMIVPFPPGQAADIFGRMLAERLSAKWGQQVIVDNRGGGGGVPALIAGKTAAPDGYTLIMGTTGTLAVNPGVYSKLPYDAIKDFVPVSNVIVCPLLLVAHPDFAPRTISELVAAAKRTPGKLNFASAGTGSSQHMTGELFKSRAGIDIEHIPYKGSGPGMTDLLGGQVLLMVDSVASALPYIKAGKIRAIAVTTAKRVPQLPDVPTIAESGYPGFDSVGWAGIVLPAATPRALVERISVDIRAVLNEPQFHTRIIERGCIPDPLTSQAYAAFILAEIEKWKAVAKEANVRLDQ